MDRTFDRTLLIRHFAICAAAITAFMLRSELAIGYTALAIVGIGALLNFLAWVARTRAELARACWIASPIIGIGSWAALISVTNGVGSPFVAGLWLEIVLSAMALSRAGVAMVTFGALAALWVQQLWLGIGGAGAALLLQSGFILVMGAATFLVTRRWLNTQRQLSTHYGELQDRLAVMDRDLEAARTLGEIGENVGRLAHGLKNAVHSLRGFTALIEPKQSEVGGSKAALAGLRVAIDDLETLARITLGAEDPRKSAERESEESETASPQDCVERAVHEVVLSHPKVRWATTSDGSRPSLAIPPTELHEVLLILLRNAAEAMDAAGEVSIEARCCGSEFRVRIRDQGVGLESDAVSRIFKPGYTTKQHGSGYGLFLARRIVERHGGRLIAQPAGTAGAVFDLTLPLSRDDPALRAVEASR